MANLYDATRFNDLYSEGYGSHLNTAAMFAHRAEGIASPSIGVSAGSSVAIIGAGFGYLAQYLVENYQFNTNNLTIIENSPYVWANLATEQPLASVRDAYVNLDFMLPNLLQLLGGNNQRVQWVITDDCIADFTDAEIPAFITQCETIRNGKGGIVHLVTTLTDNANANLGLNWKTIEQWQAFAPSHYWYDINAQTLIGGA